MTRARLLAGCLALLLVVPAAAAPRDGGPVRLPPTAATQAAPVPAPAAAATARSATGLCQCIADRSKRNISCLSSAQECQATCATAHYSFIPSAPNCPVTAR